MPNLWVVPYPSSISFHSPGTSKIKKCWTCFGCWKDTVSKLVLVALRLLQQVQLWPPVYLQTDARIQKNSFTWENKIDETKSSVSLLRYQSLTRFLLSRLFFLLVQEEVKKRIRSQGWFLLKFSACDIGFNGAEINFENAYISSILWLFTESYSI